MVTNNVDDYADLHDGIIGDTIRAAADDPNQNAQVIAAFGSDYVEGENDSGELQRGAARLTSYVSAYQYDQVNAWAVDPSGAPRSLADNNVRLQALLDAALINEAQERDINQDDLEAERVRNIKIGAGIATSGLNLIPGAGPVTGVGSTLLNNLLTEEHLPAPEANVSSDRQPNGSHVATSTSEMMVNALEAQENLPPGALDAELEELFGPDVAQSPSNANIATSPQYTDVIGGTHQGEFYKYFTDPSQR